MIQKNTLIWFVTLLLLLQSGFLSAQTDKISRPAYNALNNYMQYSNEIVHALHIFHADFERINLSLNKLAEEKQDSFLYKRSDILKNYDFFPVLPHELFSKIEYDNIYIPYAQREKPLKLAKQIRTVFAEIDSIRQLFDIYASEEQYLTDTDFETAYNWLERIEVLYFDIYTLQEKLEWSLQEVMNQYTPLTFDENFLRALQQLQPLITDAQALIKAIRAQDTPSRLLDHCSALNDRISNLLTNKKSCLEGIPAIDSSAKCPHKRFDLLIDRSRILLKHGISFRKSPESRYGNLSHPPYYYYYNFDLLGSYNRYGDGLVAIYNKFIIASGEYVLFQPEYPPIFQIVYPDIEKPDTNTIPHTDTVTSKEPSLEGFASNHLIFLLDVSSSMNEPDKLPVLKQALTDLLPMMRPEDNITIITYSGKAQVVLESTSAQHKDQILGVIKGLSSKSTSDADKGLELAYLIAESHFIMDGNNRIVLATDGDFEIKKKTEKNIRKFSKKHVFLSVFYFSSKEFSHIKEKMEALAALGEGRYSHVQKSNIESALLREAQSVRKKSNTAQ